MSTNGKLIRHGTILLDGKAVNYLPSGNGAKGTRIEVARSDHATKRLADALGYVDKFQRPNSFEMVLDLPLGLAAVG